MYRDVSENGRIDLTNVQIFEIIPMQSQPIGLVKEKSLRSVRNILGSNRVFEEEIWRKLESLKSSVKG
jgi:hypothetical protein